MLLERRRVNPGLAVALLKDTELSHIEELQLGFLEKVCLLEMCGSKEGSSNQTSD